MGERNKDLIHRLFEERSGALKAFFRRRIRSKPDAADLTQEVYLRMLRVKDSDAIRNPEGYLFTVASNLAREYSILQRRESAAMQATQSDVTALFDALHASEQETDVAMRLRRLEVALRDLSPKCRAAILMQFNLGLTYEEIGRRLGVSRDMVKKYLSQGLAHCRVHMKGMEEEQ